MACSITLIYLLFAGLVSAQHIDWVDCHDHVPTYFSATYPTFNISQLPSTLHCGRLDVPMDHAKPMSPNNTVTLDLAMYRPANPQGVLFLFVFLLLGT